MEIGLSEPFLYGEIEDGSSLHEVGLNIDLVSSTENNSVTLEEFGEKLSNEVEVPGKKKNKKYPCLICTRKFSQNAGRYNHMKKIHNMHLGEKANVRCLEKDCFFTCAYKEKLQLHLSEEHGINMDVAIKSFPTVQEFLRWKDEFERQERSRFVKKSGSRVREEGIRVAYYYCNRSGKYVSHSRGMKNPKKKGTSKTNHHCTASITCLELPDGKVEVKICSTHYGHDSDIQHLRLTQTEKFQIAEQLTKGIPRELVLDNVRASAGSDLARIHLITLKDVKNIEKAFGIQSCTNEVSNNMFCNLNVWVNNIMLTDHSPVLYYAETGNVNEKGHDVTLILQTTGQLEVLEKFVNDGIFYVTSFLARNKPSTNYPVPQHAIKPILFHVTTIMLVDDLNEAVPVVFMISIDLDPEKYRLLFESIRKKVPSIPAKALLTDDESEIFEIWCSVFQNKPYHLWSNRFVDNDWRENLIILYDEDLQVAIYEELYSYLESTDKGKLESSFVDYINELQKNATSAKFGNYITSKYVGSEEMWAGCYGKRSVGVSAQLNMEIVANELEEVCHRKHWDKNFLVKTAQILLKMVTEKQCARQTKLQRQVQELPTHHNLALNVKAESILQESDDCWRVNSVKDPTNIFSHVSLKSKTCEPTCVLLCSKCNYCTHRFSCSCRVYGYDKTMCKHIHAVAMTLFPKKEEVDSLTTCESLKSQNDKKKEITNPAMLVMKEDIWRKVKGSTKKKRKAEEETGEDNLLPVIHDILQNNHIHMKRKRGRPPKNENTQNEKRIQDDIKLEDDSEKETTNAASLTANEDLSEVKLLSKNERKAEEQASKEDLLPVIQDMLKNTPPKRKRGRPRKKENTQTEDESRKKSKILPSEDRSQHSEKEESDQNQEDHQKSNESTMKLRRKNVSRKYSHFKNIRKRRTVISQENISSDEIKLESKNYFRRRKINILRKSQRKCT